MYGHDDHHCTRFCKATNPPAEQPVKFELLINLKSAKTLGLTFPPPLVSLRMVGSSVSPAPCRAS